MGLFFLTLHAAQVVLGDPWYWSTCSTLVRRFDGPILYWTVQQLSTLEPCVGYSEAGGGFGV